jgi:hypothetical protein
MGLERCDLLGGGEALFPRNLGNQSTKNSKFPAQFLSSYSSIKNEHNFIRDL